MSDKAFAGETKSENWRGVRLVFQPIVGTVVKVPRSPWASDSCSTLRSFHAPSRRTAESALKRRITWPCLSRWNSVRAGQLGAAPGDATDPNQGVAVANPEAILDLDVQLGLRALRIPLQERARGRRRQLVADEEMDDPDGKRHRDEGEEKAVVGQPGGLEREHLVAVGETGEREQRRQQRADRRSRRRRSQAS